VQIYDSNLYENDLQQVGGFPGYFSFLHQKTGRHDITKILFKVLLNTITQPQMNSELIALGRCSMAECADECKRWPSQQEEESCNSNLMILTLVNISISQSF
jgi:hypothetical protein